MNKPSKKTYKALKRADIDKIEARLSERAAKEAKRQLRKPLLTAYDTHKTNVLYEGQAETAEERAKVLSWKQSALDLNADAFRDEKIPEKVKYYL